MGQHLNLRGVGKTTGVKARIRTGLGKSDRPGSQGGLQKHEHFGVRICIAGLGAPLIKTQPVNEGDGSTDRAKNKTASNYYQMLRALHFYPDHLPRCVWLLAGVFLPSRSVSFISRFARGGEGRKI
jgi:hypothetical protein